jgi:hypothetical protein
MVFYKLTAAVTAALLLVTTVTASWHPAAAETEAPSDGAKAAEAAAPPRVVRTIEPVEEDRWQIVDVRQVRGKLVVVSPAVGHEIDLEESNRYALFQGRTVYNQRYAIPLFDMAVAGFQRARFLKRDDGKHFVTVSFRSGKRILTRTMPVREEDDLRRLREYIEHFDEIQKGTYELARESKLPEDAEFPAVSDVDISYEDRRPRFALVRRVPGEVVLKDGERVAGELVPAYSDGRIMVQTKLDARWVDVADIERLRVQGEKGSAAIGTAIRAGVGGAASGALVGALAAWQADGDAKRTALFAAAIFGAVGFLSGLLTGARRGRGSRDFVMGPVAPGDRSRDDAGEGPGPR